jgi:hypothetical protein
MFNLNFGPGETVPHSGVYAVVHRKPHEGYREVIIKDGTFPQCEVCTVHVSFRLIQAVPHISEDENFRPVALRKTA